jgi:hypothetical protein
MAAFPVLPSDPKRGQLAPIETKLRADLSKWRQTLETIGSGIQDKLGSTPDPALKSWHASIYRLLPEIASSENDLHVVADDLRAAKNDAEYREVLVRAWPVNHFLDRMTYIGTAILGAGGAAFVFVGLNLALFFWIIGLVLMGAGLGGLWEWERKKWDFYADQFGIEELYRPWKSRKW